MTYYIKGGSRYNEANPTVWCALNLVGFTDAKYLDADWKLITYETIIDNQDPFWLFGSASGGAKEVEIGLYNDRRIKIDTTGIFGWDGAAWQNLIGGGAGGNLGDLDDVVITTPADNEVLAWDVSTSKWINQTPTEAGLVTTGDLHSEGHVLATTGPHTGSLPLTDIASYVQGSIIKGGIGDWETLGLGTENYVLKAGATDIAWGQVAWGEVTGKPTEFTPTAHVLATTGPHTGTLPWGDLSKTGSSLADLVTRAHSNLSDAPTDAHHTKYTNAEAVQAVEDTGLVLSATKVITSENANLAFTFGRSQLGHASLPTAIFSYRGLGTGSYALKQSSGGSTSLNTTTGTNLLLKINDAEKMALTATLLNMSVPIAMGGSKITGLAAATANGDAVRYEQLHAEGHVLATTGPHTGSLPLTDIASWVQGSIIKGGIADWEALAKGINGYFLKAGVSDITWEQLVEADISDLGTYVENPMNLELDGDGYNIVDLGNLTLRLDKNIAVSGTATIAGITHGNLVDKSAIESITGEWTYTVFPISPSAAPDANYEFANKKYVDDQITGGGYSDDDARAAIAYYVTTEAAFASAITAIGTGYGIIRFNAATIVLTSALLVNGAGHYIIESFGDKTVIDIGGNWSAFYVTSAASCVIRNVKIDATDLTTTTTRIIDVSEASNNKVVIENVKIIGDGTNGYGIYVSSDNCVVKNCWAQDVYNGIYLDTASYFKLINNTSYSNNYHGIYLSNSNYGVMKGNVSHGNSRDGFHVITSAYNAISGNVAYNNTYVGIQLKTTANHNALTGNNCYGNSEEGIYINTAHNNVITGNIGSNNGTNGIWLYNADNNNISGNTCNDNDLNDSNVFAGIYLSGDSDNNTIVGNTCNNNNNIGAGNGHGIHIVDSACNNNTVGGNTLIGNDVNYNDSGTGTILLGDDTAYNATSWDSDLGTATKNAIRDKIETMVKMATGNYTGNAADNRQITGLGFQPKAIQVITWITDASCWTELKTTDMGLWKIHNIFGNVFYDNTCKFISDGFEVNNGHASDNWNYTGRVYYWVAWG